MRVAYFSPLSPQETGIADYSEELLPYLAEHATLDLFIADYQPTNQQICQQFDIFDYRQFPALKRARRYDAQLYQIGNSPFHKYIYDTLLRYPGVTVLHDYVMHHFLKTVLLEESLTAYVREMAYDQGRAGFEAVHWEFNGGLPPDSFKFPMVRRILDASTGLIVHNQYMQNLIAQTHPHKSIAHVNHHLTPDLLEYSPPDMPTVRAALGLAPEQLVVASFGHVSPYKRIDVTLRVFARFHRQFPESIYLLVGPVAQLYNVRQTIAELGLNDAVRLTERVSLSQFHDYLRAADICLNLRYPTAGETSGSLMRLLGSGQCIIVSNIGSFAELPDDCCAKVDLDEDEEAMLLAYLTALACQPDLRRQMGRNARRYVMQHHHPADSAQGYIEFIKQMQSRSQPPSPVDGPAHARQELAEQAAALGVRETDTALLNEISQIYDELGLSA